LPGSRQGPMTPARAETLSELERNRILAVLDHYQGNRRAAARALGIDPSTLWRKLRRHTTRSNWSE
jgi:DNA-binding NtrC family response regulator